MRKVTIIGTGLIGGSLAIALRKQYPGIHITGVDNNAGNTERALTLGLVDKINSLPAALAGVDMIILAIPVDAIASLMPQLLDMIEQQVVVEMGSTKASLIEQVAVHPKRGRLVASHPMAGTEYAGPEAAIPDLYNKRAVVICDKAQSDADALQLTENMYRAIGMHIIYMDAFAHDVHAAYVSHISHITSFALANTVLEKEREEDAIFALASGGFESTVRLAKSNPAMWIPIFMQNRENVLDVLNEHISQLRKFKACLEKENYEYLHELIAHANTIRKIIH
jgi:prephenate dehydrogenase